MQANISGLELAIRKGQAMGSANTFGTFLETLKSLESSPQPSWNRRWTETDLLTIAKSLAGSNGSAPVKVVMNNVGLPTEIFLAAMVAGRERSLFEIDEAPDEPLLKLTKLGRSFVG
jgi:hypothetical protein